MNNSTINKNGIIRLPIQTSVADYFSPYALNFQETPPTAAPTAAPTINYQVVLYFYMSGLSASQINSSVILIGAIRYGLSHSLSVPLYAIGTPITNVPFPKNSISNNIFGLKILGSNIKVEINSVLTLFNVISVFNESIFIKDFVMKAKGIYSF
jgi:hypothetical protein